MKKKQPLDRVKLETAAARRSTSPPPVHSPLLQYPILFDPIAFSGLNHEGVCAPYFLEREEVEVGEVVARQVEVVSDPSVPVVSHSAPVLSASLSTGSCRAHFSHILRRFSLACSRPMGTGDVVTNIGILAGDVLFDGPGLAS